jgi:hypothetical protein
MVNTLADVTKDITAENVYTDGLRPIDVFNVSITGTWVATVFLQRSFDGGTNWVDVESWTTNVEDQYSEAQAGVVYRLGIKTGGFTSGTSVVALSQ